ncbi:3754_t:CDS:2, partial [Entrophospora sp. SA101]
AKTSELKKTRIQPGRFPVLEDALYKWFQGLRSQNIPVSQELLKTKALYFYNEAKNRGAQFPEFEASRGWLENFQNRYGISSKNITGESQSANLENVEEGRARLNIDHAMTAEEFVNVDSDITTTELPTDENIIEDILISEEGKKVLEITKKFLEQQEFATEKDVRYVNELIKRLNSSVDKAKRQSLLTEFMNIDIE